MSGEYWCGVDLGARVDRSAIVVVEALRVHTIINYGEPVGSSSAYSRDRGHHDVANYVRTEERRQDVFEVAEIIRLDQGAPHSETLAALADVYRRLCPRWCHFDDTGLGVGFHDYVRAAHRAGAFEGGRIPQGVTITARSKPELMAGLDRLVDESRIRVPAIPGADKLRQEMRDFHYRYTSAGNVTTGAVTEAAHDDLVVATALAVYPTTWNTRPSTHGSFGAPLSRPCRVIKRIEHLPMPHPKETQ
jgi:hypothetical protein